MTSVNARLPSLDDESFRLFQSMMFEVTGIKMSDQKKALVGGRLSKRIRELGLNNYGDYFKLASQCQSDEHQVAVDLLTTNETFFFREAKHFDFIQQHLIPGWRNKNVRLWSAASSSGQEAYSLAMLLSESNGINWEVLGTDINRSVIQRAARGQYSLESAKHIPEKLLKKYCLRGIGSQSGTFMIHPRLKKLVSFQLANLKNLQTGPGQFELIMLRNVMIYFDLATKRQVVEQIIQHLKPGGYLMIGHSESLNGVTDRLKFVQPSVYQK
jgi:chemotaxis protein methyltransferase CheR